jgi:signal transduction histidine kinase
VSPILQSHGINASEIKMKGFECQPQVYVDMDQMRQVFYNLLSNAIKYKKRNEIPNISIEAKERDRQLIVEVKDWGVGICSEDMGEIFKMGVLGNYAKKSNIKGKGFGLWVCKELLVSNHLNIQVRQCFDPTILAITIPTNYWSSSMKGETNDINV